MAILPIKSVMAWLSRSRMNNSPEESERIEGQICEQEVETPEEYRPGYIWSEIQQRNVQERLERAEQNIEAHIVPSWEDYSELSEETQALIRHRIEQGSIFMNLDGTPLNLSLNREEQQQIINTPQPPSEIIQETLNRLAQSGHQPSLYNSMITEGLVNEAVGNTELVSEENNEQEPTFNVVWSGTTDVVDANIRAGRISSNEHDTPQQTDFRTCWFCGRTMNFKECCEANTDKTEEQILKIWKSPIVEIACCSCTKSLKHIIHKLDTQPLQEVIVHRNVIQRYSVKEDQFGVSSDVERIELYFKANDYIMLSKEQFQALLDKKIIDVPIELINDNKKEINIKK